MVLFCEPLPEVEPLPLTVRASFALAAAAPVAAVPALEFRLRFPAETFKLEPTPCDCVPEIRSVPEPDLVTAPDKASGALISCVPEVTAIDPVVPSPTVKVPPLPGAMV